MNPTTKTNHQTSTLTARSPAATARSSECLSFAFTVHPKRLSNHLQA